METFWINESKPLELKSFSGICAPPCTCQWRWMFCEWNHVSLPSIMGSLHEVLSAIAFCMLLSAMLPHHGTLLSHSPALHCSWSSSMQPEIVHGEMMWKDHVPCGRRIVIKCQSSNANGWFVNMDDKESYNKGACCQATSLWVSRRDAYCSLDTRCRRSVSGDCIQQTSNWATWRYTNTFLYIHFYIYMCVYIYLAVG